MPPVILNVIYTIYTYIYIIYTIHVYLLWKMKGHSSASEIPPLHHEDSQLHSLLLARFEKPVVL